MIATYGRWVQRLGHIARQDRPLVGRLALVVAAEVSFAVVVALGLGRPPAPATTIAFGLAMAAALGVQTLASTDRTDVL